MKKLLLLILAMAGMSGTASAADYVIVGTEQNVNGAAWNENNTDNRMIEVNSNQYYLIVENCNLEAGATNEFKVVTLGSWSPTYPLDNYPFSVDKSGVYTLIYTFYFNSDEDYEVVVVPILNLTLSNNYNGVNIWDTYNSNGVFSHKPGTNKWTLDIPAAPGASDWYFRIFKDGLLTWNSKAGNNKLAPNNNNTPLIIGGDANGSWIGTETNSWKVEYPSYDFDHFTITAEYDVAQRYANHWNISADAYISKSITSEGVATFGSAASVDFTKAIPALTAKKGQVNSDGKINWVAATSLYGGEGALIEGTEGTYLIPVTTSAAADSNNDFVAITEKKQINQTENEKNAYILAKVDNVLGFCKPADTGSWCASGTAYLSTNIVPASARGFFPIWDDTNSINATTHTTVKDEIYTLSGQRVAAPTKGLYIVNGKKSIIK